MQSEDRTLTSFKNFLDSLTEKARQRFFYALDYVLNYFRGDRRIPHLYGINDEIIKLEELGIVYRTSYNWRGNVYLGIKVKEGFEEEIRNLLREKYYPTFKEDEIENMLRNIVREFLSAASELWNQTRLGVREYTLSVSGFESDPRARTLKQLAEKLSECGLGYLVGYYSSRWITSYDEFFFRTEPCDVQKIFMRVTEEEINNAFTTFGPAERWCAYLKFLQPTADEKFLMNNASRFLPLEIKEAANKVLNLKIETFDRVVSTLLLKEEERLLEIARNHSIRDPFFAQVIGMLLSLGGEEGQCLIIPKHSLDVFKETFSGLCEKLSTYIRILQNHGVVLISNTGDLVIPKILQNVFNQIVKGASLEVKIFESKLDAEAFVEEEIAKAKSNIKIWDPYVKLETLGIIERSVKPNSILVEILSSQPEIIKGILALMMKQIKVKAKIIYRKQDEKYRSPFHDRYLIIDERYVWHFGPSLHAAGEKEWESASLFPEYIAERIVDAFKYNFDKTEQWRQRGYEVVEKGTLSMERER